MHQMLAGRVVCFSQAIVIWSMPLVLWDNRELATKSANWLLYLA